MFMLDPTWRIPFDGMEVVTMDEIMADLPPVEKMDDAMLARLCEIKTSIQEQEEKYRVAYHTPQDFQLPFHKSNKKVRLILGANQCLGGEAIIYDPVLGVSKRVDSIDSDFHVHAWDGDKLVIADAHKPFTKPKDKLYRFEFSNGQSIVASMGHHILTSQGYKPFSYVARKSGFCVSRPPSSSGISLSTLWQGVIRSLRTVQDSLSGCQVSRRSGDARLLAVSDSGQGAFPLQADVPEHTEQASLQTDAPQYISPYSRPYQYKCHLSNQGEVRPLLGRAAGFLCFPLHIFYLFGVYLFLQLLRLPNAFFHQPLSIHGFVPPAKPTGNDCCSLQLLDIPLVASLLALTNVTYIRTDYKYDFTVPIHHNYLASGVIHHNTGKSLSSTVEGILISLGKHPYKNIRVPNKGRIAAQDLKKGIGEVVQKIYEEYCPKLEIKHLKKYPGGEYSKITYNNGSTVDFLSYEQDTKSFEGWTGDWVQFDEPPPRSKYIASLRGLMRFKGICWIAETPLSEAWVYDEIFSQAGPGADQPDVWCWDITQNKYLSPEQVADFVKRLTPEEIEARAHGKFKHLSGLIYKELDPAIHFIEPFDIPPSWNRYVSCDYHSRMPCAILWMAISPQGRMYFYDELWVDKTVSEIVAVVKLKENKDKIRSRVIDSISATPERVSGTSAQREFARYGLHFRSSNKSHTLGMNAVHEALAIGKDGLPGCYFMKTRVDKTIHCMSRYQWTEFAGGERDGEKEQPAGKFGHFPDCVRYLLVMRPGYKPPLGNIVEEFTARNSVTGYNYGGED